MANIDYELRQIAEAIYGRDVRSAIYNGIDTINKVSEVVLSTGTAVNATTSSSTGYYNNSLYLNLNTYDLWRCQGTNSWVNIGNLKGPQGAAGANGENGNKWYRGTAVAGKSATATAYATGITNANVGDNYLNKEEGAVYHCTVGGSASVAKWVYDFTLTGGSGGGGGTTDYNDLDNKPSINNVALSGNKSGSDLGLVSATDLATVATSGSYNDLSNKPSLANVATSGSYNDLSNKPTIPTIPTDISAFNNDVGYITDYGVWYEATSASQIGDTSVIITAPLAVSTANIDVYASNSSGNVQSYTKMVVNSGVNVVLTFPALTEATRFKVWVH